MTLLLTVPLRAIKIPTTLKVDVPVAFRTTKNLEDTVLSVNYWSWQRSFSELPKSCQQWELTFLSTVAFRTTKILSTVGVDILFDRSFQSYKNTDNFKSWHSCSFQSYQKPGRHYASRQLSELKRSFSELPNSCQQWELAFPLTVASRAIKFMPTVRVDIPADRSFQNYQNPDNFKSRCSCSFQSYQKPGRHYAFRQLSELTMQLCGTTRFLSTLGADIPVDCSFKRYQNLVNNGSSHSFSP